MALIISAHSVCRLLSLGVAAINVNKHLYSILLNAPAVSPTVKGRTNLKIKEKYLSPAGSTSKGLTVSRSNSSLSLYSSASAPTSPMTRKARQRLHPVIRASIPACAILSQHVLRLHCFFFFSSIYLFSYSPLRPLSKTGSCISASSFNFLVV